MNSDHLATLLRVKIFMLLVIAVRVLMTVAVVCMCDRCSLMMDSRIASFEIICKFLYVIKNLREK